jgi:uncharacterized protein DUF3313
MKNEATRMYRIAIVAAVLAALGALFVGCASTPVATGAVGPPWTGQTFLPNYKELKPVPTTGGGQDYIYMEPGLENQLGKYGSGVMVDQPEVFISPQSPYTGAKPADLESIAEFVREQFDKQLKARGYKIVAQKGPGVIFVRVAITDLQLQTKSRNILAYTPVGFVINAAVKAVQDFLQKMDILNLALQGEFLDGETGQELAAGVIARGGNGSKMSYDDFEALIDEYGARFACRLDNGRVPEAQRIDCTNPAARKGRPLIK